MSRIINGQPPSLTTRSAPGSASRRQQVVTHFETWAVSQISEVMDESHRIWQSIGSRAQVARFVKPPVGAGSIAGLPLRKQVALGRSWLFLQPSNSQRSCQIRNTRTSTAAVIPVCEPRQSAGAVLPKTNVVTCSTCFIRTRSGSVVPDRLKNRGRSPTISVLAR